AKTRPPTEGGLAEWAHQSPALCPHFVYRWRSDGPSVALARRQSSADHFLTRNRKTARDAITNYRSGPRTGSRRLAQALSGGVGDFVWIGQPAGCQRRLLTRRAEHWDDTGPFERAICIGPRAGACQTSSWISSPTTGTAMSIIYRKLRKPRQSRLRPWTMQR